MILFRVDSSDKHFGGSVIEGETELGGRDVVAGLESVCQRKVGHAMLNYMANVCLLMKVEFPDFDIEGHPMPINLEEVDFVSNAASHIVEASTYAQTLSAGSPPEPYASSIAATA